MSDDYEILAVRYGTRSTSKAAVYLNYDVYGEPDEPVDMDYFFWIVRNEERTIVVDCGYDPVVGERRKRTTLRPPIAALADLGVDQIDQLVVTHAHYDHIGNLGYFSDTEIAMSRIEFDFWTGPLGTRRQFLASAELPELAALAAAGSRGQITLIDSTFNLAPGIELVEVGGHAPGQLIVVVGSGDRRVVLASDAIHYYEELELDRPFHVVADLAAMYRGFDVLNEMAGDPGTVLVAGHDPEVMERFAAYDGGPPGLAVDLTAPSVGTTGANATEEQR